MKEIQVINRKSKCLQTKQYLLNDTQEYSLDNITIAVDSDGKCYFTLTDEKTMKTWKCNITCKSFCSQERQSIIEIKNEFSDDSVENIRQVLQTLNDGCEQGYYSKRYNVSNEESTDELSDLNRLEHLRGHPLPCSSSCCFSWLRLLRAGAVNYPFLRTLLKNIYCAKQSDNNIRQIESALSDGTLDSLKKTLQLQDLSELLDDEEFSAAEPESLSTFESHLEVEFASIIEEFYKNVKEDWQYVCCSCERLFLKKVPTHFTFAAEKFNSSAWVVLRNYLLEKDPDADTKTLYVWNYCRPIVNKEHNNIPARCVLNGLYTEPIPEELSNLNALESQFIQCAKCFQTVIRLGTYTGKIPIYNRIKVIKGTIFFLPLP